MADNIEFYKGNQDFPITQVDNTENHESNEDGAAPTVTVEEAIKKNFIKVFSSSHLSFLLGAGCSAECVPTMKRMSDEFFKEHEDLHPFFEEHAIHFPKTHDLEKLLETLFAMKHYFLQAKEDTEKIESVKEVIKKIKDYIFDKCKVPEIEKSDQTPKGESDQTHKEKFNHTLESYKSFYKKLMYRENMLSKINVFTTNYDLFNETAMDDLGIIYCNGFSGTINRYFNPMTFNYAYAEQIDLSQKKYIPLEQYVYLYKLHGSINWIEEKEQNQLFGIKEVQIPSAEHNSIMIYPTPHKQSGSFSSPYSDLFREFQKKLMAADNILVTIGYSFSDEHINNIIYQALATIPKFRLVIFDYRKPDKQKSAEKKKERDEIDKLKELDDPRIWIIRGELNFKDIVGKFFVDINPDDATIEKTLEEFKKIIVSHDTR